MTNYEKICAIINAGHIAQVEYEDWNFQLISSIMKHWFVRWSYLEKSIEECFKYLWIDDYSKTYFEDTDIKSISVYKRSLRYPKEWELVTILDTIKDEPDYEDDSDDYKEMIGWPFEVKFTNGNSCAVYNTNKSDFDYIDYRHLVPYLWEETKTDELSKWKEVTVTIDGKEYKAIIQ